MTIMIPAWENGELQQVEKLDAHVRGLKHKAVSIFVMNRGRDREVDGELQSGSEPLEHRRPEASS